MAAFVKFESFTTGLAQGLFQCGAGQDDLKVYLTNNTPDVVNDVNFADLPGIAAGNGYPAGGLSTNNSITSAGGVASVVGVDVVFTASGGSIGPFQYVVLYDDTAVNNPLIGYWSYGSSITLNDSETLTVDFGSSMFTIT
jgi:hypothetical protein